MTLSREEEKEEENRWRETNGGRRVSENDREEGVKANTGYYGNTVYLLKCTRAFSVSPAMSHSCPMSLWALHGAGVGAWYH